MSSKKEVLIGKGFSKAGLKRTYLLIQTTMTALAIARAGVAKCCWKWSLIVNCEKKKIFDTYA